ncbi:MAG: YaiO family outer membrane beta-barrel protein [Nitrospira sp.]|nr:YaiO family outer membrane beta-barrel protein [Nitrospira sp.]
MLLQPRKTQSAGQQALLSHKPLQLHGSHPWQSFYLVFLVFWILLITGEETGAAPQAASPRSPDARIEQARQLEAAQQYGQAEALYREILRLAPDRDDVRAALARVLSWQGLYAEAIDLYRSLVQRYPNDVDLKTALARVLSWQKSTEDAKALYEQVLRHNPHHAEALEGLANLFYWEGRFDEALVYYERAHAVTNDAALAERISAIKSRQSRSILFAAPETSPQAPLGSRDSAVRLPFRDYFKVGYGQFSYSRGIQTEHAVLVEAAKSIGEQTLVGRVESLHRFGFHDVPISAELYSPLWARAWGYVAAQGTVDARFTPTYSAGGELYQGLGILHSLLSIFEVSVGYRWLSYRTDDINLFMPSLTVYLPFDTWLTEQLYWVPETGAMTLASRLTWRPTPRVQLFVSGSFGTSGERIVATQDITRIGSHTIQGGFIIPIIERLSLEATGYYEDRGRLYARQGGNFAIIYHW